MAPLSSGRPVSMTTNARKLLRIGTASAPHEWPNYVQDYQLSAADIPELVVLLEDRSIIQTHNTRTSKKSWAPIHAWRALGQLRAVDALPSLFQLLDGWNDFDYALEEIYRVLAMIGEPALAPAQRYFQDRTHPEFSRVMAMDALKELALQYPHLHKAVLTLFADYLKQADPRAPSLNALLILHLADLRAYDLWPAIQALYEHQQVDPMILDQEDAEIEFGLRHERSTPRPRPLPPKPEGDDADALDVLEHFLQKYGREPAVFSAPELDGLLAGLACAPQTLMPSQWLPVLWGGEQQMPEWESQEDIQEFHSLLMEENNRVMADFIEGDYSALFYCHDDDAPLWLFISEWCFGFMRTLPLYGPLSAEDELMIKHRTAQIHRYATEEGFKHLQTLSADDISGLQASIEADVTALHQHFFQQQVAAAHTPLVAEPRVGRNDLCPCGSGKKFKKCCLH